MQAVLGFLRIFDIKYVLFIFFQIKIENWYNLGFMFILENCMHEFGGGGVGVQTPSPSKIPTFKFTQEMEGSFLRVAIKQKRKKIFAIGRFFDGGNFPFILTRFSYLLQSFYLMKNPAKFLKRAQLSHHKYTAF